MRFNKRTINMKNNDVQKITKFFLNYSGINKNFFVSQKKTDTDFNNTYPLKESLIN